MMIFTRDPDDRSQATLVLHGEIDIATASVLRHIAESLPLQELRRLVVDLGEVSFMDSTGVAFLISLHKRLPAGSELVVAQATPIVNRVLHLSGLAAIMELDPTAVYAGRAPGRSGA